MMTADDICQSPIRASGVVAYLDDMQRTRTYTTTRSELRVKSGVSETALVSAVTRLKNRGRLTEPRRGFLVLLPLEHQEAGSLPASWWIHELMAFLGQSYYVGLLAAAAIHGAAPDDRSVLQVVTDRATRPVKCGQVQVDFFQKGAIAAAATELFHQDTGTVVVSSPEETAYDLVRYSTAIGDLNHVASILTQLGSRLNEEGLAARASLFESTVAQKLGYLLDLTGHPDKTRLLHERVMGREPARAPLTWTDRPFAGPVDRRWAVVVNCPVDAGR